MAGITDLPGIGDTTPGAADAVLLNWINAAVRSIVATVNSPDVTGPVNYVLTTAGAGSLATAIESAIKVWNDIAANPESIETAVNNTPAEIVAYIVRNVTGLTFSADQVNNMMNGTDQAAVRRQLGQILTDMYAETLKPEAAAQGWLNRNPGEAELENFRQLSGAAMRIQLGDLVLGSLGKAIPFNLGAMLADVAEKINAAIALDDALEEVVQVPMQAVIQRGLEAKYNRELKPADFTNSEARQALLSERIDKATYDKILDNSGLRDDVRDTLLDFAASNLTESDINEAYQHNLLDRNQVKEEYKNKFFREPERELKTKLVEGTRRWQLEQKIFELYGNLYRDGVATKDEIKPYLDHYGLDPDEQDMWFLGQELERRQRKWLTNSELEDLVKDGFADAQWAIEYNVLQGMTGEDATLRWLSFVIAKYQKQLPEDCQQIIRDAFSLPKLLASLMTKIPELGIGGLFGKTELKKVLECLLRNSTP